MENKQDNKFRTKAIGLSYVMSHLLIQSLEVLCREIKDEKEYGQMNDKLTKLKSSSKNAFRIIDKMIGDEDYQQLIDDVEQTLDELWGD
jgi:hypothetical protein